MNVALPTVKPKLSTPALAPKTEWPPFRVATVLSSFGSELALVLAPVNQIAKRRGGAGDGVLVGIRLVALHLGAAGFVAGDRAEAETHLLLFDVDLDDLELMLLTRLELGWLTGLLTGLRDVTEAFNALRDLDEGAELSGAEHLAVDDVSDAMRSEEALPDIGLKLLDAERQAAILRL